MGSRQSRGTEDAADPEVDNECEVFNTASMCRWCE